MESLVLFLISFFHFVFGIIVLYYSVKKIISINDIRIFDCFKIMYGFIYGIVQGIIYLYESMDERNLYYYDYSQTGLLSLVLLLLICCFIYLQIVFWYDYLMFSKSKSFSLKTGDDSTKTSDLLIEGLIMLIVGIVSIYFWTRAYGSIENFILNADAIRSSRGTEYNPFAFLQHFSSIILIAFYALIASYFKYNFKGLKRILHVLSIVLSAWLVYIYLLCTDSRVTIAYVGISVLLLLIKYRKTSSIAPQLALSGFLCVVLLLITMFLDTITYYVRYGEWRTSNVDILHSIINEFRFTVSSEMMVMNKLWDGSLEIKFFDDIINSIFSWFPESWTPFVKPESIWNYNTMNIAGTLQYGQSPSDIIATSIYGLNLIGIIVYPLVIALILKIIESILRSEIGLRYYDVFYVAFSVRIINFTSHNQLSSLVLGCFSILLFYLIIKVCKIGKLKKIRITHN